MNIYFVVEGETETLMYSEWLKMSLPFLEKVDNVCDAVEDNYYLFSCNGFPCILDDMINAAKDINNLNGIYDYLVVCLDTDDKTSEDIKEICFNRFDEEQLTCMAKIIIIPQSKCIETWLLGNRSVFSDVSTGDFLQHKQFYNVHNENPELMNKPEDYRKSASKYHVKYLKSMLRERKLSYSKTRVRDVCTEEYYRELEKRINETEHLHTFREWLYFCTYMKELHERELVGKTKSS